LVVQDKQVEVATSSVSHAMDMLEACNVQTLIDTFHEYPKYEQHLKWFMFVETKHKEYVKQQRLGFIAKCLREFDIASVTILEAIKWD